MSDGPYKQSDMSDRPMSDRHVSDRPYTGTPAKYSIWNI